MGAKALRFHSENFLGRGQEEKFLAANALIGNGSVQIHGLMRGMRVMGWLWCCQQHSRIFPDEGGEYSAQGTRHHLN